MSKKNLVPERKYNIFYIFSYLLIYPFFKLFFRKIKVTGIENYNSKVPTIFAANHNNAFLDAIIFHYILGENIYSLARGDVFKNPVANYFLSAFHVLPIFRMSEGAENLHKNEKSFLMSVEVLKRNNALLIFPEGNCVQEKHLRPLKKGLARIAFMAEEKADFNLNLHVIPVGINYTMPSVFRGNLTLNFGKSIKPADYKDKLIEDRVKTYNTFTKDMYNSMKELIVHIDSNQDYFDFILTMQPQRNLDYRILALNFNSIISDEEKKKLLFEKIDEYKNELEKHNLYDEVIRITKDKSFGYVMLASLIFIIALPVIFSGVLLNAIPIILFPKISKRLVKNKEFYLSVLLGLSAFGYLIYNILLTFIISFFSNVSIYIIFFSIPILGYLAIIMLEQLKNIPSIFKLVYLKSEGNNIRRELIKKRKEILNFL